MTKNHLHIPDGWYEKTLGDVLKYEQPYKYAVSDTTFSSHSGTPVLTAGKSFILGYTNEAENIYLNLPVIIFDDFTTDCKFVDFPFKVKSSAMKFLKERNNCEISLKYIFEVLQTLKLQSTGGDHKRRWISEYSKLKFACPSINEQTRIAQILSTADRAIEQTQALIAKYQRIKTGLMQDLLTKGIDEHGRIRSEKTHRFKTEKGLRVPEEWEVRDLGTLCDIKGRIGWQGYTVNDLSDDVSDPIVIGGTQISKEHKLDFTKPVYLKRQKYLEAPEIFVKFGDIVLVKTGNTIGKTALVDEPIGEATINPNTVILRDFKDITNRFLYLVMISEYFQKALWDFVFVGAQPSVNQTNMKTIKIPLPNPNEQLKITGTFFALTKQIDAEREKLSKLQTLKTGLMQDLLSGRVRVSALSEAEGTVKEETFEKQ